MSLGDLQQLVMLAVARLGVHAYGAGIRKALVDVGGRSVSVATVYVTLVRLEEQGMVTSRNAPQDPGKGGRARRIFELTPDGWSALEEARMVTARMWEGVVPP